MKRRILIVETNFVIRKGLLHLIGRHWKDTSVVEKYIDPKIDLSLNMIITDFHQRSNREAFSITKLKKLYPQVPVLVYSALNESIYALSAFIAGASGYLSKNTGEQEIKQAISLVLEGGKYFRKTTMEGMYARRFVKTKEMRISAREFEIAEYLARGEKISQIASKLTLM